MIGLVGYYDGCLHHRTPIYLNWQEAWNLNISAVLSIHLIIGINTGLSRIIVLYTYLVC